MVWYDHRYTLYIKSSKKGEKEEEKNGTIRREPFPCPNLQDVGILNVFIMLGSPLGFHITIRKPLEDEWSGNSLEFALGFSSISNHKNWLHSLCISRVDPNKLNVIKKSSIGRYIAVTCVNDIAVFICLKEKCCKLMID